MLPLCPPPAGRAGVPGGSCPADSQQLVWCEQRFSDHLLAVGGAGSTPPRHGPTGGGGRTRPCPITSCCRVPSRAHAATAGICPRHGVSPPPCTQALEEPVWALRPPPASWGGQEGKGRREVSAPQRVRCFLDTRSPAVARGWGCARATARVPCSELASTAAPGGGGSSALQMSSTPRWRDLIASTSFLPGLMSLANMRGGRAAPCARSRSSPPCAAQSPAVAAGCECWCSSNAPSHPCGAHGGEAEWTPRTLRSIHSHLPTAARLGTGRSRPGPQPCR